MKAKIKFSFGIFLFLFMGTSCNYLNEDPITNLGVHQIFNTESGIESALLGCYVSYSSYDGYGDLTYEIQCNSIILESSVGGVIPNYSIIGSVKPEEAFLLEKVYSNYYVTLNRINDLILNAEESVVTDANKQKFIAEAKFLRATVYFDLVRTFGRVPLQLKPVRVENDAYKSRASLSDVYLQILKDLTEAEVDMPTKELQVNGRPHKWAASATKARVYLFLASMTQEHLNCCKETETLTNFKNHFVANGADANKDLWQKCYDNALKVKNSGVYELVPQYSLLWNGKSRNTKESVFELQFSQLYGVNAGQFAARTANNKYSQLNSIPENGNAYRITAGRSTFIEHWKKYGNGKYLLTKTKDATPAITSDREVGADPRINTNYVYYSNPNYLLGDPNSPQMTSMFPQANYSFGNSASKFVFIRKYQSKEMTNMRGSQNLILFRYAELLLILAEAANELDDKTTMKSCIEEILSRARNENTAVVSVGNDPRIFGKKQPVSWNYDSMSKDSLRLSIMQEREFELMGEGQELFDVRRRGIDYLKRRMDIHSKWFKRQFVKNNTIDPSMPNVWEGWGKTFVAFSNEAEYTDLEKTPEYLTKSLYLPIPAKEFRINRAMKMEDQNIGWW